MSTYQVYLYAQFIFDIITSNVPLGPHEYGNGGLEIGFELLRGLEKGGKVFRAAAKKT